MSEPRKRVREMRLRVCIDCGDEKYVAPYAGGRLPERCIACAKKRWNARNIPKRRKVG